MAPTEGSSTYVQDENSPESSTGKTGDRTSSAGTKKGKNEVEVSEQILMKYQPLHRAAFTGDWEAVINILKNDRGARTAKITIYGETILHIALGFCEDSNILQNIIDIFDVTEVIDSKHDLLIYAINSGNPMAPEILLVKCRELLRHDRYYKVHPVVYAASHGFQEVTRYLFCQTNMDDISNDNLAYVLLSSLLSVDLIGHVLHILKARSSLASCRMFGGDKDLLKCLAGRPKAFGNGSQLGILQGLIYHWISVDKEHGFTSDIRNSTKDAIYVKGSWFWRNFTKRIVQRVTMIRDMKQIHVQAQELLDFLCDVVDKYEEDLELKDHLKEQVALVAVKCGNYDVLTKILRSWPSTVNVTAGDKRNLFHFAVALRHEKIMSLLYQLGPQKIWITSVVDNKGYTLLHRVAKLPSPRHLLGSGPALQMQREMQWFKVVDEWMTSTNREWRIKEEKTPQDQESEQDLHKKRKEEPDSHKITKRRGNNHNKGKQEQNEDTLNQEANQGLTARELFTKEHRKLRDDAEKWMRDTAQSSTVVAALIATMVFAAAFTVPGGNNSDTGRPIFLQSPAFMIFAISDALALFSSITSVLAFTVILTSPFSEEDFMFSLPLKMIIGLVTLSFSAACMMVAFCVTLHIALSHQVKLIVIPISLLAVFPVFFFVSLQLPLLAEMLAITFRKKHLPTPDKADLRKRPPGVYEKLKKTLYEGNNFFNRNMKHTSGYHRRQRQELQP